MPHKLSGHERRRSRASFKGLHLSAAASGGMVVGLATACLVTVTGVGIALVRSDGDGGREALVSQQSAVPSPRPASPPQSAQPKAVGTKPASPPPLRPKTRKPSASTSSDPNTPSRPTTTPKSAAPPKADPALTPEARMIKVLNNRRRALGLPLVRRSTDLEKAARECAEDNWENGTFEHCGHEVLYKGGSISPEDLIATWFSSAAHKAALTYDSSRNAGAAIVPGPDGSVIAALNIDY